MDILNYIRKNSLIVLFGFLILSFVSSCSGGKFWDPADARTSPANVDERVQRNLEEGKGWSVTGSMGEG